MKYIFIMDKYKKNLNKLALVLFILIGVGINSSVAHAH